MSSAARFSRRCSIESVPGIGSITGERRSSQASAICAGVAPWRSAIFSERRAAVAAQREERHEHDPLALAVVDDVVVPALGEVVVVLHGRDRHDPAGALDLLDAHLRDADVADRPRSTYSLIAPRLSSSGVSGSTRCR